MLENMYEFGRLLLLPIRYIRGDYFTTSNYFRDRIVEFIIGFAALCIGLFDLALLSTITLIVLWILGYK